MSGKKANTQSDYGRHMLYIALLVGTVTRVYRLGHQSIWGDEALTVLKYVVGDSAGEVLANVWQTAFHPPLYFVIVHVWTQLGDSDFMLRVPSAVAGVIAIPLTYLLARRLFGSTVAGISALVIALSPFHIWYSQEARMYSQLLLLSLGSMLFFMRAWESRRFANFALYGLFTVMALFTHIGALLLIAAQGVFAFGGLIRNWRENIVWVGVQMVVIMAFLPWILHFMAGRMASQGTGVIGFVRDANPLHMAYGLYTFAVGYSLGPSVAELHYLSSVEAIGRHLPEIILSGVVFGALGVLGLIAAYRANRMGFWFIVSHLSIPLLLAGVASLLPQVPLNPRYIIAAAVPYWMLIGLGVSVCIRRKSLYVLPVLGVALIGFSLYNHYFEPAYAKQDMRAAVEFVNKTAAPGDVIIISSVELGGPFIHYFSRDDVPYVGYPPGMGLVNPDDISSDMDGITESQTRAWLVLGRTWSSDPHDLIPAHFVTRYEQSYSKSYDGVVVKCFELNP